MPAFRRFEDFVTTKPLEGLGGDMGLIKRLCASDPESLDLLDQATQGIQGKRTDLDNNVIEVEEAPQGNSRQKAIRKLRNDRPDLHARVMAGELSPNAAMIEAGFRQKSISVPVNPEAAGRRLARHFTPEQFEELAQAFRRAREPVA